MRVRIATRWLWVMALSVAGVGLAETQSVFPARFSAQYTLHSRGFTIGITELALEPLTDGRFEYVSRSRATGAAALIRNDRINERSIWQFDAGRVQPLHYHYERTGGNKDREVEVEFDWSAREVINTARGKTWRMPVPAGALDKLSYVLALMQDLHAGVGEASYAVADGGKLKTYRVERLGTQNVDTPFGNLQTQVVRRTREGSPRQTTYWCAATFDYLPVKIEHRERDGEIIILRIGSVDGFGS